MGQPGMDKPEILATLGGGGVGVLRVSLIFALFRLFAFFCLFLFLYFFLHVILGTPALQNGKVKCILS
jgi:hypothetical protein